MVISPFSESPVHYSEEKYSVSQEINNRGGTF